LLKVAVVASRHSSLRHRYRAAQHGPRELLRRHRFREQESLHQIEAHLAHGEKVRPRLDALGHGTCSVSVGDIEDLAADRPLQPVIGAAGDELSIDLELNERKIVKPY
jgi:hypothetical protein